MKTKALLVILSLSLDFLCFSQTSHTDSLCKSEIRKLEFMTGNWKGAAWTLGLNGEKNYFEIKQKIQFKLDTTLLHIERMGIMYGQTVYNELDIISFVKQDSAFVFDTFLSDGNRGRFKGSLSGKKFNWHPYDNTDYTILLNEQGEWSETAQLRNGDTVIRFLEIKLEKQ